jgi:hypothetical protein
MLRLGVALLALPGVRSGALQPTHEDSFDLCSSPPKRTKLFDVPDVYKRHNLTKHANDHHIGYLENSISKCAQRVAKAKGNTRNAVLLCLGAAEITEAEAAEIAARDPASTMSTQSANGDKEELEPKPHTPVKPVVGQGVRGFLARASKLPTTDEFTSWKSANNAKKAKHDSSATPAFDSSVDFESMIEPCGRMEMLSCLAVFDKEGKGDASATPWCTNYFGNLSRTFGTEMPQMPERKVAFDSIARLMKASGRYGVYRMPRQHVEGSLALTLKSRKDVDFNFVGSLERITSYYNPRYWVVPFAESHFTENSLLVDTSVAKRDRQKYIPHGTWDHTRKRLRNEVGWRPNEEEMCDLNAKTACDPTYLQDMARSRFVLAPAGDLRWSPRFFEAIMSKAIPIVEEESDCGHSYADRNLGYYFLTAKEAAGYSRQGQLKYCPDWAEHNMKIFLKNQAWPGAASYSPPKPSLAQVWKCAA